MRGGIALFFALNFPAMVEKPVLVSSGGLGKEITLAVRLAPVPFLGE